MNRTLSPLQAVVCCCLLTACGKGPGAPAASADPAPPGALAARAAAGQDLEREEGDDDAVIARARRGLQISPVPLATAHLSHQQKVAVGLGSYIANGTSDCNGCHGGPAGFLSGGNPFAVGPGQVVWSRNLTPDAATGLRFTEAEFLTVIRTGKDHLDPARMLIVMPWIMFRWMSDDDLKAVYAYLRAVPPVSNAVPPDAKSALPLPPSIPFPGFYDDGEVDRPLPHTREEFSPERGLAIAPRRQPAGLRGNTLRQYGRGSYIANSMTHCSDCHTSPDRTADGSRINTPAYLSGGTVYAVPPPLQPLLHQVLTTTADLKGATHGFFNEPDDSYARFRAVITTQSHADEVPPRPLGFPMNIIATNLSLLLEEDLEAVYTYVKHVPSVTGPADKQVQEYSRWCAGDSDCAAGESCHADGPGTSECVGRACGGDLDCDTCQTCNAGRCAAPAPGSLCVLTAH